MAISPKQALTYFPDNLKEFVDELEMAIDDYLQENYLGQPLDIKVEDIYTGEDKPEKLWNTKVRLEIEKRYKDWQVEVTRTKQGLIRLTFSDTSANNEEPEVSTYINEKVDTAPAQVEGGAIERGDFTTYTASGLGEAELEEAEQELSKIVPVSS